MRIKRHDDFLKGGVIMNLGNIFPVNDKSFGIRLKSLMDYNNLNASSLATRICGFDYQPSIGDTSYTTFISTKRSINKHLNIKGSLSDAGNNVTSRYISDYCRILDCEPDFLFGYIDSPTHKKTDINKEICLSSKSVETLQKWKESLDKKERKKFLIRNRPMDTLNLLLSEPFITERLFKGIEDYLYHDYHIPAYHDNSGQCVAFTDWQDVVKDCDNNISAYSLTLLKDNTDDMRDNRNILIDENFLDTVALKNVERYLFQLQQKMIAKEKKNSKK